MAVCGWPRPLAQDIPAGAAVAPRRRCARPHACNADHTQARALALNEAATAQRGWHALEALAGAVSERTGHARRARKAS